MSLAYYPFNPKTKQYILGACGGTSTNISCVSSILGAAEPPPPPKPLKYYIIIDEFITSCVSIPTSTVSETPTTIASSYLAGRSPLYNFYDNSLVGNCSASFLSIQADDETIYSDITNFITADKGLILTWFTPTLLANLEIDSVIRGMVTECIVKCTTKVGGSIYYGKTFNMVVSSDGTNIYFEPVEIPN